MVASVCAEEIGLILRSPETWENTGSHVGWIGAVAAVSTRLQDISLLRHILCLVAHIVRKF